jgi:hypothetical protein
VSNETFLFVSKNKKKDLFQITQAIHEVGTVYEFDALGTKLNTLNYTKLVLN